MKTLPLLLHQNLKKDPERIALHMLEADTKTSISYEEYLLGASSYSHALNTAEIGKGDVVIIILQHGLDLVYAFWGSILLGAIPSIMPFLTEKVTPETYRKSLTSLIGVTKPAAIITYPEFLPEIRTAIEDEESLIVEPPIAILNSAQVNPSKKLSLKDMPGLACSPRDVAFLQHSSGTTGLQKGVALSHQAVLHQVESYAKAIRMTSEDIVVSWLPLYHDMGLIAGFVMPILLQSPLVLMSPFDWVRAPYKLMHAVTEYQGTLSWLPNFAYNFCAKKIRDRDLEGVDLSSWRAVINCSEPMRWHSHQMFLERFEPYGLKPSGLATCYAMAENVFAVTQGGIEKSVVVDEVNLDTLQRGYAVPERGTGSSIKLLSAGVPIKHTEVRVLTEDGTDASERQIGEIAIRSNCMLTGYYNRQELTEKAFLDGWYLTGDLGYLAEGELYVTGRIKEIIIVGGKNIYPQDLEELAGEVPGVHPGRVVAFGIFNTDVGTEDVGIVAETDTDDPEARRQMALQIRDHVTRNSDIAVRYAEVVDRKWLIKTSSGKIARSANRKKFLAMRFPEGQP
jgi:acyl-CoA synthetase (AMP-forming)/AMP-acid ligase II